MRQTELFSGSDPTHEPIDLPGAELWLERGWLPGGEAQVLFEELQAITPWEQESIVLYGRECLSPRWTAWYGDPGSEYVYSGIRHRPLAWTPSLLGLKQDVEREAGASFNSALLNLYRDGNDSVAWHSDDETELGARPQIASLSLGAERTFSLKHKSRRDLPRVDLELSHGSLLWMGGACQEHWLHQVPKRKRLHEPRINVTFRLIH